MQIVWMSDHEVGLAPRFRAVAIDLIDGNLGAAASWFLEAQSRTVASGLMLTAAEAGLRDRKRPAQLLEV
jgi:hypothetical protein